MSARVLVVSGWSNTGKSTFTEWLASEHGFVRLDMDEVILSPSTANPRVIALCQHAPDEIVKQLHTSEADTVVD